jgi:ureidoglycolate lyase
MLERHAYSTQLFVPRTPDARYQVVVALGADRPDLSTLAAFEIRGGLGITYRPGVWHHPMIARDTPTDFLCLVWEDGTARDCDVIELDEPLRLGAS